MSAQFLNQIPLMKMGKNSDALSFWLFIASVIHAIVLMGVSFDNPKSQIVSKAIEVTIVNSAARRAPENAKYFAQANQIAAGLDDQKPMPMERKKTSSGYDRIKQHQTKAAKTQTVIEHRLITQKNARKKLTSAEKHQETQDQGESEQEQPELSMEELDRQIAQLGARIEYLKESSEKTKIKSINAISAHQYVAAQYIKDWERKVERVGNLNLPEVNGKKDFSGVVTLDVGINADGGVYNIVTVKSSGVLELDQAAIKIVNMNAPFEPLPEVVTRELDVLEIRREFVFSNDGTFSTSDN